MSEADERALATEAIELALAEVTVRVPLLAGALRLLDCEARPGPRLATDGSHILFDPALVVSTLRDRRELPVRDVAHVLVHCILTHPHPIAGVSRASWSLAADLIAEQVTADLLGARPGPVGREVARIVDLVTAELESTTTLSVARALDQGRWCDERTRWASALQVCDHGLWFATATPPTVAPGPQGQLPSPAAAGKAHDKVQARHGDEAGWARLARTIGHGVAHDLDGGSTTLSRVLEGPVRHRDDLRSFIARFARSREVERISDEDFDPILYTYGLRLFGNLPLIEPLEQSRKRHLGSFAFVLDTSASVDGEAVRAFVDVTYDALAQAGVLGAGSLVHIIQADTQIQLDTTIRSPDDLVRWRRDLHLAGFGGTDFRPAFAYVDDLLAHHVIDRLDGLVYLTDGLGVYPREAPAYPVAFALWDTGHPGAAPPAWAQHLTIDAAALAATDPASSSATREDL